MIIDISIYLLATLPFGIRLYRRELDGRVWTLYTNKGRARKTDPIIWIED